MKGLRDAFSGLGWFLLVGLAFVLAINLGRITSWGAIPVVVALALGGACAGCMHREERMVSGCLVFWIAALVSVGTFLENGWPSFPGLPGSAQFLALDLSLGHEWDRFAQQAGLLATWPVFILTFMLCGGFTRDPEPEGQAVVQS